MRVLCCCPPLEGLLHPLFPLAAALTGAGHDVRFATGPNAQTRVRQMGFVSLAAGPSQNEAAAEAARMPGLADLPPAEIWRMAVAMFARVIAPAQLRDLEPIITQWHPDLVVHAPMALAAPLAAAAAGVPSVAQGFGLLPRPEMLEALSAASAPLWQSRGLQAPDTHALFGSLYLHPVPPSLDPNPEIRVAPLVRMRLDTPVPDGASLPAWADQPGPRPLIYVGLGTVPPFSQPAVFEAILRGITQRHDLDIVVTVGEQNDISSLGPQPSNVHVERWLPLPLLLPRCTAAICHAGSGTTLAALRAGLPMLLVPQGADQFENADACAHAGVARVVTPDAFSPESVAAELKTLLSDARYGQAAQRLRAELMAMLSPAAVVPLVEQLAGRASTGEQVDDSEEAAPDRLEVLSREGE